MVYFLAALCGYWYVRRYLKAAYGFYAFSPSMGLGPAESLFRFSIFWPLLARLSIPVGGP